MEANSDELSALYVCTCIIIRLRIIENAWAVAVSVICLFIFTTKKSDNSVKFNKYIMITQNH